jgi:hypothetical protein
MEDVDFFHKQAGRWYQLAWRSSDLDVVQNLKLMGNDHTTKARTLQGTDETPRAETNQSKKRA